MTGFRDAITARRSCRTFDRSPLSPAERSRIEALLAGPHETPFRTPIRFALLDASAGGTVAAPRLGTYGVIRGAPAFIGGAVPDAPGAREDFGFALERVVLRLTGMGLATCWLAGTYRRGPFADRLALGPGEILPAVTPVGHPAERPSPVDAAFRIGAGSSRRRAWEDLFTVDPVAAGAWAPCLEAVRLGPSARNAQPWRIAKEPDRPVFHLGLAGPAPRRSPRRLDAGIAMCHFALVAAELGLPGRWITPEAAPTSWMPPFPRGTTRIAVWFPA